MIKKLLLLGLLTLPTLVSAQFLENFDGGTTLPTGWTVLNGGDSETWEIADFSTSEILAHSGTNVAVILYGSTAHDDYLISPAVNVTTGVSDFLTFWARSRDPLYPEVISLKLSTTGVAPADFTETLEASVAPVSGLEFYKYQYDLSAYVGQTIYIGFYSSTTDMFAFDLDDVEVTALPSCLSPTNPAAIVISDSEVDLSWTSDIGDFEVEYGAPGFVVGTGTTIPTVMGATNTTLNGLMPNTDYEYYVRRDCGNSNFSTWEGPKAFTTLCSSLTSFPFVEGFENGTIPTCWDDENVSGSEDWTYVAANGNNSITPRTGAVMAEFRTANAGNATKLVLPPLDLTGVASPELEFYYANVNWFGDVDELRVFYKESAVSPWVQIGTDYVDEQAAWTQVTLALPNPSATYYIAFEGTSNWARGLNLDDVTVQSSVLSSDGFDKSEFSYYPNPVKNSLSLSYSSEINTVEVFNLLGQKVLYKNIDLTTAELDMSSIPSGNYLVKVYIGENIETIKIVKE